jgi:hypothetical protein
MMNPDLRGRLIQVAYGVGVNSTAMLIGLQRESLRPDRILFADTGGENPETYAYLPVIQGWLAKVEFPPVIVVRRAGPYASLEDDCLAHDTLPSLAFGLKSCSLKWKRDPQNAYCKREWPEAARAWGRGERVAKLIGYDAGPADLRRVKEITEPAEIARFEHVYPLIEWGWDRDRCQEEIARAGLPVPPKSACFFCPASKWAEVRRLARDHPELVDRAVTLEVNAAQGKHGLRSTRGLGRNWSWLERLSESSVSFADRHEGSLEVFLSHVGRTAEE